MKKVVLLLIFILSVSGLFAQTIIRNTDIGSYGVDSTDIMKADGSGAVVWGNDSLTVTLPFLKLNTSYTETMSETKGTVFYDKSERTVSVSLGNGVVMQINQETLIPVHNGSGDTIMDGRILGAIGGSNDRVSVAYADKHNRYDALIMSTEIILPDSIGLAVEIAGRVNRVNTGSVPIGPIFLDTLGLISDNQGVFPEYNYPLGAVVKTGVTDGIIQFRSDGANYRNDIRAAFDGAVRETFDFRTFSNGTTVYGVLSNPTGDTMLTLMFSDGWVDHIVPDTIALPAGTSTNPQDSYVFIDKDTQTLQYNTSGFSTAIEHAQIAKIALLDAATTQTYGALRNQNINNHLKYDDDNGHIIHIGERIRVLNAQWDDGVALTVSGTPTNLYVATTSGHVWQMHLQSYEAHDMSAGDDIHVVNDPTTPYTTTTNLNTVTTYSDGTTWNNEWQNLVIWGVANKSGEISHIMVNLASAGYLTEDDAIEDASNFTNYTIPRNFRGVGFLIARISVRRSPTGYTFNSPDGLLDLRGYFPNNTAGGGAGGSSGYTLFSQLDDTPSSYLGSGEYFTKVTAAEDGLEFVQFVDLTTDVTGLLPDGNISSASTWNAKIGGSLTTGYMPYASGASTLSNSYVYRGSSGGTLINTTSDNGTDKLQVNGSILGNRLKINNTGNALVTIDGAAANTNGIIIYRGGVEASRIAHSNSDILRFYHGSGVSEKMSISSSGVTVTNDLYLNAGLRDASNSLGSSGNILKSTGTATAWGTIDTLSSNINYANWLKYISNVANDSVLNTDSYISNVGLSGNTLTFTGVGSAFNSTVGNIANLAATSNTFTGDLFVGSGSDRTSLFDGSLRVAQSSNPTIQFNSNAATEIANINVSVAGLDLNISSDDDIFLRAANGTKVLTVADDGILADLDSAVTTRSVYFNTSTKELTFGTAPSGSVSFGTSQQIPYMNGTNNDFSYSSNLTFNGSTNVFSTNRITLNDRVTFNPSSGDDFYFSAGSNVFGLASTSLDPIARFTNSGSLRMGAYGSGSVFSSTLTYGLGVGSSGDVIEIPTNFNLTQTVTSASTAISVNVSMVWISGGSISSYGTSSNGRQIILKNKTAGAITVPTYTVKGSPSTSTSIAAYEAITLVYDGTLWYQIN